MNLASVKMSKSEPQKTIVDPKKHGTKCQKEFKELCEAIGNLGFLHYSYMITSRRDDKIIWSVTFSS